MYDRFTDRARKVLQLANQEAQRLQHSYISGEHILLGLLKEGSGIAATVLKDLGLNVHRLREEIGRFAKTTENHCAGDGTPGRLPLAPSAKQIIEDSIEESRRMGNPYVGTEHLLLGVISRSEGIAARALMAQGLHLQQIREKTLQILGVADTHTSPANMIPNETASDIVISLDSHLEWLQRLMERFIARKEFEMASEVLSQLDQLRRFRK